MSDNQVHVLEYRAGASGFGRFGTADDVPHWHCAGGVSTGTCAPGALRGRARIGNTGSTSRR